MKLFLFSLMTFFSQYIIAQTTPVKKVYAYRQAVLQGKKPAPNETVKKSERFFIYAEVLKKQKITVTGIWMEGNYYNISVKQLVKSPVQKTIADGMEEFTFVPKTVNTVYEIVVGKQQEPAPRPGRSLGVLLQKNEVVIPYTYRGKTYYTIAEKMTVLESVPLM